MVALALNFKWKPKYIHTHHTHTTISTENASQSPTQNAILVPRFKITKGKCSAGKKENDFVFSQKTARINNCLTKGKCQ